MYMELLFYILVRICNIFQCQKQCSIEESDRNVLKDSFLKGLSILSTYQAGTLMVFCIRFIVYTYIDIQLFFLIKSFLYRGMYIFLWILYFCKSEVITKLTNVFLNYLLFSVIEQTTSILKCWSVSKLHSKDVFFSVDWPIVCNSHMSWWL